MVNGALTMKHLCKAFYGALLVLGLAGIGSGTGSGTRRLSLGHRLQLPAPGLRI